MLALVPACIVLGRTCASASSRASVRVTPHPFFGFCWLFARVLLTFAAHILTSLKTQTCTTDCYRTIDSVVLNATTALYTVKVEPASESPKPNARFYGVNLLSELDVPGEFYLELSPTVQKLHVIPPAAVGSGGPSSWSIGPTVATKDAVVDISNTSGTSLANVYVRDGRGVGIRAANVANVHIHNITASQHGEQGIYMVNAVDSSITDSTIKQTGCAAIRAHGGNATTLEPGNLKVTGNYLTEFALWKVTYQAGIHWAGVKNVYSNNVVKNGPHNCFLGGGNEADAPAVAGVDCVFDSNTLDTCAFEAADTGAFYVCGQAGSAYVNRNNTITGSSFTNIRNTVGTGVQGPSVQAIYLDDQMSGWSISNNSFYNCQTGSFIGGGRRNTVRNNYYEKCDTAHHFDNRGMNWEKSSAACTAPPCEPLSGGCQCNPSAATWMVTEAPAASVWASRFPYLKETGTDRSVLRTL